MEYQIITATFETEVYNEPWASGANKYVPFPNSNDISFADASIDNVTISDDDGTLGYLSRGGSGSFYDDSGAETSQALTQDTVFGFGDDAQTLPAGTRISYQDSILIGDGQGNQFYVFFPAYTQPGATGYPAEAGGRHTVMIVPKVQQGADGASIWPAFDATASYRYLKTLGISAGQTSVSYAPDQATCFTPGTLIETRTGPRAVETLVPGDLIATRDHGFQVLRWIGGVEIPAARLDLQPNLRPIRITAGALGTGLPARDLVVSPQHRVLVRSAIAQRMFGADEVLVAAKHLCTIPGIDVLRPEMGVTYLHLLFDRHELVMSNGGWTESLYIGPQAMQAMTPAARHEITALFPQLVAGIGPQSVRPLTNARQARKLAERHLKNNRVLVAAGT